MSDRFLELARFLLQQEPWMDQAHCRQLKMSVDDFVLDRGRSSRPAKEACAACEVSRQCEDYAERTGSVGIWAGSVRTGSVEVAPVVVIQDARPQTVEANTSTGHQEVVEVPVLVAASRVQSMVPVYVRPSGEAAS